MQALSLAKRLSPPALVGLLTSERRRTQPSRRPAGGNGLRVGSARCAHHSGGAVPDLHRIPCLSSDSQTKPPDHQRNSPRLYRGMRARQIDGCLAIKRGSLICQAPWRPDCALAARQPANFNPRVALQFRRAERVSLPHVPRLKSLAKPAHPLFRRAMREAVGHHIAL